MLAPYIKQLSVITFFLLLFNGCTSNNGPIVIVKLTYHSTYNNTKLYYANVISGADKFHWYELYSNKKETVTLYPGLQSKNKITLFYQYAADKPKQVWEGPELQTVQGYRIHITIHENGNITERSCNLPCNLNS